ncbi:MAG: amidohydrolase [Clostridia bacterium]|nr:amidohydrolase [Clostridia bacterium]
MFDILFRNICVVNPDTACPVQKDVFVGVKDGKIAYIDKLEPQEGSKRVINGANTALIPGLINTHTHAAMSILRGYADDHNLQDWLHNYVFPAEAKFDESCVYTGTQLAIAEMIRTGTVSITDMYMYIPAVAKAAYETGIYANITNAALVFDREGYRMEKDNSYIQMEILRRDWHNTDNGRIKLDSGIHAEYTSFERVWQDFAGYAKQYDLNMQLHLSETKFEHDSCVSKYGKTPARVLCDAGVFDTRTTAAHCVWLTDEDMDILREKGVTVAHNPVSNLKLASGVARVSDMLSRGVNVALGTDGVCSNNSHDMFEEMKLCALLQKGTTLDPKQVNACQALSLATVSGAYAQGREGSLGLIKVGYDASMAMIDLDVPQLTPVHNPLSTIVYSASGRDVCMTMVRGKVLYENGEFTTIDMEKIKSQLYGYVMPKVFGVTK